MELEDCQLIMYISKVYNDKMEETIVRYNLSMTNGNARHGRISMPKCSNFGKEENKEPSINQLKIDVVEPYEMLVEVCRTFS